MKKTKKLEAKRLIEIWKERLNLQDWRIKLKVCSDDDMEGIGQVEHNLRRKVAVIYVRKLGKNKNFFQTVTTEEVIVHEMMHLHFVTVFPKGDGGLEVTVAEQSVDKLAHAFLKAYGKSKDGSRGEEAREKVRK